MDHIGLVVLRDGGAGPSPALHDPSFLQARENPVGDRRYHLHGTSSMGNGKGVGLVLVKD